MCRGCHDEAPRVASHILLLRTGGAQVAPSSTTVPVPITARARSRLETIPCISPSHLMTLDCARLNRFAQVISARLAKAAPWLHDMVSWCGRGRASRECVSVRCGTLKGVLSTPCAWSRMKKCGHCGPRGCEPRVSFRERLGEILRTRLFPSPPLVYTALGKERTGERSLKGSREVRDGSPDGSMRGRGGC